jgi:SAM-dependent methyltransferase
MKMDGTDKEYLAGQYGTSVNLNARLLIHQRFSMNHYGWFRWVFDQFDLPAAARILELGSGMGDLWRENLDRLSTGWEMLLSDFSVGMLERASAGLTGKAAFAFKVIDATQPLPCEDGQFDAVIADHMLYHIANRGDLLAEIRRVLKPGGRLYATTVGQRHLNELRDLTFRFDPSFGSWSRPSEGFTLENGAAQLAPYFAGVELRRYEDALLVTEAGLLSDYILSGWAAIPPDRQDALRRFIAAELVSKGGVIRISKDSGMLVGRKE